jgi:mono/diheme cytochrome c family protein
LKAVANDGSTDAPDRAIERGRYIMNNLAACTFCHTPLNPDGSRDNTKLLAGFTNFFDIDPTNPNVGALSSRNLTNHETGLKNATDQQIKDAIRNGNRTDGKVLTPVMPYWIFHNMTDSDLDAIIAYLRTVPGVDNRIPPNQQPWLSINDSGPLATPIDPADIPVPMPGPNSASAMRGRYLSSMVGLCIDCHTPDRPPVGGMPTLFPQPIDPARAYAGGRMFPREALGFVMPGNPFPPIINTRNLTPDATGLMGWTVDQIKAAIAEGKDRNGKAVCAATHGSLISPFAALEPQDLTDIANYLVSLPPLVNDTAPNCEGPPVP